MSATARNPAITPTVLFFARRELDLRGNQRNATAKWCLPRTHEEAIGAAEVAAKSHAERMLAQALAGLSWAELANLEQGVAPLAAMEAIEAVDTVSTVNREAWLSWYCDMRLSHDWWTHALATRRFSSNLPLPVDAGHPLQVPLQWTTVGLPKKDHEWRLSHSCRRSGHTLIAKWSGQSIATEQGIATAVPLTLDYHLSLRRIVEHVWPMRTPDAAGGGPDAAGGGL